MQTIAKGLSVLCLLGAIVVILVLQVFSSNTGVSGNTRNSSQDTAMADQKAIETNFSCKENESATDAPADLGVTRILTPIISEYLSGLMPRLLH